MKKLMKLLMLMNLPPPQLQHLTVLPISKRTLAQTMDWKKWVQQRKLLQTRVNKQFKLEDKKWVIWMIWRRNSLICKLMKKRFL